MRLLLILAGLAYAGAALAEPPPATATPAASPPPPAGCTSVQSGQFDFWIGRWDVFPTAAPTHKVADSLIEKLYSGCAIRENWAPLRGGGPGGSLSSYVAADPGWRQTWVGSDGETVTFRGAWDGHSMVFQAPDNQRAGRLNRMTFTPAPDGSVRQHGEVSDDGGHIWTPDYDFTYRRAP